MQMPGSAQVAMVFMLSPFTVDQATAPPTMLEQADVFTGGSRSIAMIRMAKNVVAAEGRLRVPELSGKVIRVAEGSNYRRFWEEFRKDGTWAATFLMRSAVSLRGRWTQRGAKVCVSVDHGSWKPAAAGKTICREIRQGARGYMIPDIASLNEIVDVSITSM